MRTDGYSLWLSYNPCKTAESEHYCDSIQQLALFGDSSILDSVRSELHRALPSLLGKQIPDYTPENKTFDPDIPTLLVARKETLTTLLPGEELFCSTTGDAFCIRSRQGPRKNILLVYAEEDAGLLYGVFSLLRLLQSGTAIDTLDIMEQPRYPLRMLNHWDNLGGSIERGYAGMSLWNWAELPEKRDERYTDYARAMASIGLNATVLNNVNTQSEILSTEYLLKVQALADIFRNWGIQTWLSVNFGSPCSLGGLNSSDPLDKQVQAWWKTKADEIYSLIPDFGGFLVKADSEGQPGPFAYGRTHADGANMLSDALKKHGGSVIWRAFVYGHGENDRAKKAYINFMEHDGEFRDNVAIQVKNGPIDFQPREPVHPLFAAMRKTQVIMEFQITQEYLGQGNHIVYLAPMWKEILDFDTHADGKNSTVDKYLSGIAAVSNIGNDQDWCGSLFHPMNWYAYGRLCWNPYLSAESIASEWIQQSWPCDKTVHESIMTIMMDSWEACVDYMCPLGLHHIMKEGHHYGPDPAYDAGEREDWRSTYYHRASKTGLGFNRTRTGSAAVDQYFKPIADIFNSLEHCPEKYLLWFHHVPWDHVLSSGRTLKDELIFRYERGVKRVERMRNLWKGLEAKVDPERFNAVLKKMEIQLNDAHEWHDVCLDYFMSFT